MARILHLSDAREARAEGRALGDLKGQAGHGCRGAVVATSLATFAGTRRAAMVSWITPAPGPNAGVVTGAGSSSGPATGSRPVRAKTAAATAKLASDLTNGVTRAAGSTKAKHGSGQNNGIAVAINPSSSTSSLLPILIALLALTGAGLLLWPLVARRRQMAGGPDLGSDAKPTPAPPAPASAAASPVGPAGAAAAGAAAAGAAAGRAPANRARQAAPAAPRAAKPAASAAPTPRAEPVASLVARSAPRALAASPAAGAPSSSPGVSRSGRNNGRKAALVAVGSAAAMRGLRVVLSRRRAKP